MISVIKIGGKVLESAERLLQVVRSLPEIHGHRVLVHGGGSSATRLADRLGVEVQMREGRRITDDAMLEIVTMVYAGLMNKRVVAHLQAIGQNALGLTGADLDLIRAHKRPARNIDYGWVGDIDQVNPDLLIQLLEQQVIPVLAPLTHDGSGNMLNTNADTIASSVATALAKTAPVRLVYCFELPGVMRNPDDPESLISELSPDSYQQLKHAGIISGGMIPKLDNAFRALQEGVQEVVICQEQALSRLGRHDFPGSILSL